MIDKRLNYKDIKGQKHMLAYITPGEAKQLEKLGGQKTMTKEGIPAYPPEGNYGSEGKGQGSGPGKSGITGMGVGGGNQVGKDPSTGKKGTGQVSGPDRSAVSQFSTYGKNKFNQNLKGPNVFSQIGTGIKNYITGGGMIGMGIRGLSNFFGGAPPVDPMSFGNLNIPGYNQLNIAGPVQKPDFGDGGGDGQEGIMAMYNPNMLNVSGEVEEEVPVSKEEEDFKQRFRVANEFRQDKQGQLDPAILEMISKLYT